ncbi:MAG: glycoside hydrolase family 18 protein [Prevotella sp.]|nr:glycoside hydrolase family 18 protein [Staphylococcus sp.]MCM1351045.1 glycoside hydrolase family 18 protein [Prevotella sp.]
MMENKLQQPLCAYIYCNHFVNLNHQLLDKRFINAIDIVYYSFVQVNPDGTLMIPDAFDQYLPQIKVLTHYGVKVLMSINHAKGLSEACSQAGTRKKLIHYLVEYIQQQGLQGIDIDWEVPGNQEKTIEEDKNNLNCFVQELRQKMNEALENSLLTIAIPGIPFGDYRFDYTFLNQYIDYYNVMSYDANIDDTTSHLCPLYPNSKIKRNYSIDEAYQKLVHLGVKKEKIIISAAFYGKVYQLQESPEDDVILGKKAQYIPAQYENGVAHYDYIQGHYTKEKGYEHFFDATAHASYLYHPKNHIFITYDDVISIKEKALYAKKNHLGIMFWDLGGDNHFELFEAIYAVLKEKK